MQNAAIYFHPDAFDTSRERLLGRHSAGESFLRGFMRHADVDGFHFWNAAGGASADLDKLLNQVEPPTKPVRWISAMARQDLSNPGVVSISSPSINQEAWHRRSVGAQTYAICGLTHTTATARVMSLVGDLLVAPTEPHDALICTSSAVRTSVESQLDGVRAYMEQEYGPRRRPEFMRATIPLGVNTADFAVTPQSRKGWRERLGIPEDAPVALYVGRFNVREKMNPALMAIALEKAAQATGKTIYWVNSGWLETGQDADAFHKDTQALCPSVRYIHIDGRPLDVRFSIWSVADFFISLSDNIQETFGITPIEAMAAGLPCVVTDWNGYKDTVRHGEDGFRVPTVAPAPGLGGDLAFWYSNEWMNYTNYVAATAQYVAIDYAAAVAAISILVLNADYRRKLGEQAKAQARSTFDWQAIIPQHQALWAEQDARRRAAPREPAAPNNPFRPDPYALFANYPTRHMMIRDIIALRPGVTWSVAEALMTSDLVSYSALNRPSRVEYEKVFDWLAPRTNGRVVDLLAEFPEQRRAFIRRGLLWLARYDLISVQAST